MVQRYELASPATSVGATTKAAPAIKASGRAEWPIPDMRPIIAIPTSISPQR